MGRQEKRGTARIGKPHRPSCDESDRKPMDVPTFTDAAPPLRVFVVENHPDTLRSMRMYLELMGHTVASACTSAEAVAAVPDARCDVLISDIGLPDGDGWDLLRTLHEHGHAPAFAIAMSGFGMNADHVRSHAVGYRHHLLKPFAPSALDAMLAEAALEISTAK